MRYKIKWNYGKSEETSYLDIETSADIKNFPATEL